MFEIKPWFLLFFSVILAWTLGGCGRAAEQEPLLISTAANLQPAISSLADQFQKETATPVQLNVASSGKLAQQIHEGAPVDVFLSANRQYVQALVDAGLARQEDVRVIARGRLVVWRLGTQPLALEDLARPEIQRVAVANPDHAPYGAAAREVLQHAGLWERMQPKLVYADNVMQAYQFAASGDVDAALLPLSLVLDGEGVWTQVPEAWHTPLEQTAVVLPGAHEASARAFVDFLMQPAAQALLAQYGYEPVALRTRSHAAAAWASRPSASAMRAAMALSAAPASGVNATKLMRLMKSSTFTGEA